MKQRNEIVLLVLVIAAFPCGHHAGEKEPISGQLTAKQVQQLDKLEVKIKEHAAAAEFGDSLRLAREILVLREKWQGPKHWQALNARSDVEVWQRRADLPADKLKELTPAIRVRIQAETLRSRRQFAAAEKAFHGALDVYRKVLGEKNPDTAECYSGLANCLSYQGKHALAQPLYQKSLDIYLEVHGEKHRDTAVGYNNVAANLYAQRKYSQAQALYQKALDIWREVLGENHPLTASGCNNVAQNLKAQSKYAQAQPFYQQALDIQRKLYGEKHPDVAVTYEYLATNVDRQGNYSLAQSLEEKSLAIKREIFGDSHLETAISRGNLAGILMRQGSYAQAQPLYQNALDTCRAFQGEFHPNTAGVYNGLAFNLHEQGKYAQAQPLFLKAFEIYLALHGEKHPDTALSYNNIALNLNRQGKYAQEQPLHEKALSLRKAIFGENHSETAASYNNLAACLSYQGKYAEAEPLAEKALAIYLAVFGEKHPHVALSYNNLAYYLSQQRKYVRAESLYRKALELRLELGEKHLHTAQTYSNLALNWVMQNEYAQAQPLFQKALAIARATAGENNPRTNSLYQLLAANSHKLGEYALAEKSLRATLQAHDVLRMDRADTGFEKALLVKSGPRSRLAVLLARRGEFLEAWQLAETELARGLLDDFADPQGKSEPPQIRLALLRALDKNLLPLLSSAHLDAGQTKMRDDFLRQRQELFDEISRRLAQQSAERVMPLDKIQQRLSADAALVFWIDVDPGHWVCVLRREGPPRWQRLAGSGKDGAWTGEDDALAGKLYAALATPAQVADGERKLLMSAFLQQRFDPVRRHLQAAGKLSAVRKLLVVPTGAMAYVPLEALTTDYTISYVPSASVFARLAQQHRPMQAASLLALGDPLFAAAAVKPAAPPAEGLFVQMVLPQSNAAKANIQAGDVLLSYNVSPLKKPADLKLVQDGPPVNILLWRDGKEIAARLQPGNFGVVLDRRPAAEAVLAWRNARSLTDSLNSTGYSRLPATRFEVQTLSRLVGQKQKVLLGSEASEQALDQLRKDGLKQFRLLHFATHGHVDTIDPRRSALILAQDKLPDRLEAIRTGAKVYDGRLTVETILRDWQLDADLVVLSACQTGLGKPAEGEGLLGFAQGFLQKGARSVVLSRWKVDDTATALLMLRFYENVLGKREGMKGPLGRADALEEARTWLRNLGRTDAERLAAGLTGGELRGTERKLPPPIQPGEARLPAGDRPFAHPFYWASFVLIGDPD